MFNIREDCLEENSSVMTENYFSEVLKAEFDMEILSEVFGKNRTLSIEVSTC